MNIQIKPGVQLLFIDDRSLTVFNVVSEAFRLYGEVVVMTSAADGEHGKDSYHKDGLAWDFRAHFKPLYSRIYKTIRTTLKNIDGCYDVVFEKQKGNEHIHIEYDQRRAEKLRSDQTGLDIDNPKLREDLNMANPTTTKWILSVAAVLLGNLVKIITKKFREELEEWVTKKYAEALETENPFDDLFFEFLAKMLDIEI